MSALEGYLQAGQAEVTAYDVDAAEQYEQVRSWPCADFLWDPRTQVLAWWWAGDEGPHAFRMTRVQEDDYTVTLFHPHGKVELGPVWNDEQEALLARWREDEQRALVAGWLELFAASAAGDPVPAILPQRGMATYQTMIELLPVLDAEPARGELQQWALIGAWAADADEIAFYALPQYAGQADAIAGQINAALAGGWAPLDIFDYWWQNANRMTVDRRQGDPVQAASAAGAAETAARRALERQISGEQ